MTLPTDTEASLPDAQDYDYTREETRRPGLGWTDCLVRSGTTYTPPWFIHFWCLFLLANAI